MSQETFPYLLPYILSVAVSLSVAVYAWRRRSVQGAFPYGWVAFGQALWTFGYIFELTAPTLAGKHFWDDFQWLGALIVMVSFPVAILEYARIKTIGARALWGLCSIIPLVFLVFLLDPTLHRYVHGELRLLPGEPFSALVYDFTPLVWAILIYNYALFLGLLIILFRQFINPHRLYRAQVALIMIGILVPLVGAGLTMAGVTLSFQRDTTPLTFAVSNLMIAWGLFRYGLFDIVPIARDTVVENMSDLVIVLDAQNRIVDINPIALYAIEKESKDVIGKFAGEIFAEWPKLLREFEEPSNKSVRTTLSAYGKIYHHEVKAALLHNQRGEYIGRVFVSRDVTAYVELQENLKRLNDELEQRVQERTRDLEEAYDTTLEGWAKALELRDKETEGHSWRVTDTTIKLALALGVPHEEFEHIRRGAILHDIGKMAIPDEILRKTGPLSEQERDIVLQHPTIAYQLLSRISFLKRALDIPWCHHEKWDGTGYPRGLKEKEIPLVARIFAVADVWDAVQSDRPYKKGWSRPQAVAYLQEQAGKYFDPEIVKVFLRMVEKGEI